MTAALERLIAERNNIRKSRKYLFSANQVLENNTLNLYKWKCTFPGPNIALYEKSYYEVTLTFTKQYPFSPPKVKFTHSVFHPNVYTNGEVCLDVLSQSWKPSMNIMQILTAVQQLLVTPNEKSPANGTAVCAYKDKKKYNEKVRENIEKYHSYKTWYTSNT
ncbi:hypothetical protein BDAP_001228 [Binucleata daphniae]